MANDSPEQQAKIIRRWFVRVVRRWYETNHRELPWRRDRDSYKIWISEVMLQQTQVATVIPYFERFLSQFPNVEVLAKASEQDVLRLWEGLGYYRRARALHQTARILVADHQSELPCNPELVRTLPGFGEYTTNAVLSQAYDVRLPILEANSQRVLSRLFGRREDPTKGTARKWLWRAAEGLLPQQEVGDINQALMEVGSLVCTPTAPRCDDCPLTKHCVAHRLGEQETIPAKSTPPATVRVREVAVVIRRKEKLLLVQRPEVGRWSMMWEFPHGPLEPNESEAEATTRLAEQLTGMRVQDKEEVTTLRHSVTHHRITLICREAVHRAGKFRSEFYRTSRWLSLDDLVEYPVSSPQRRLIECLTSEGRQRRMF